MPPRARASRLHLAQGLRADPRFAAVNNGDAQGLQRDREFLFRHRYLLSEAVTPQRFTVAGCTRRSPARSTSLASPEGAAAEAAVCPRSDRGVAGDRRCPGTGARAAHQRGRVELARRHAGAARRCRPAPPGADTDAQQAACEAVRAGVRAARDTLPAAQRSALTLRLTGPPVFAVAARVLIKHEVMRLSSSVRY